VDNNDLYQVVLLVSAVAGCLGALALLGQLSWLPLWLAWVFASCVGYIYGEIQAAIVCKLLRIRQWGEVTTSGLCKVGCPYFIFSLLFAILFPLFKEARQKAHATGQVPQLPAFPIWAFPIALSSIVAVVAWGLHVAERRRGRR
jgi:hypothetical protein